MEHSSIAIQKLVDDYYVSRETVDRLIIYHDLLLKWQRSINLISRKTIPLIWERHFLDSAQLFSLISDREKPIFDLGSGGGFPGLVISLMGANEMHLIESDQRKCAFLTEVIRRTDSPAKVHTRRIESFKPDRLAMTITSRACAPLTTLLPLSAPLLAADGGTCLFLKGQGAADEVEAARQTASFHVKHHPSRTDPHGCILEISDLALR